MRNFAFLFTFLFAMTSFTAWSDDAAPTQFNLDPVHSKVGFKVRHMGISNTTGKFSKVQANWVYHPEDEKQWKVWASIDAASIDTDNTKRDNHLRSGDFFDAGKFKEITFQSTEVTDLSETSAKIKGNLTIKGVTKEVTLDAELTAVHMDDMGTPMMGLSAKTKINRQDYGIKFDKTTKAGEMLVGDEITIELEIEGKGQKPAVKAGNS